MTTRKPDIEYLKQIDAYKKKGLGFREIARVMKKHPFSVWRAYQRVHLLSPGKKKPNKQRAK